MEFWKLQFTTSDGVYTVYVTAATYADAERKARTEMSNVGREVEALLGADRLAGFVLACKGQDLTHQKHIFHSYKLA